MLSALIVYLVFPHISNNHKAKLLHPLMIGISVAMFLLTQLVMPFIPRYTPIVLGYVSSVSPEEVIDLTNKAREAAGVPKVETDPALTQAALGKASYMIAKNFWAHTAPDGTEPWKFITDSAYQYRYAGENLARDFANSESVVKAWVNSPSHKENLLSSRYQDIGVAVVKGELDGVQTTLVVQFFGTKMGSGAINVRQKETQVTTIPELAKVAGSAQEKAGIFLSPFFAKRNLAFFLVSLFFLVLSIDMIIVGQRNTARVSSKSFAHLLFLAMVMGVIVISKAGNIL